MRTGAIFARGSCRALKWMTIAALMAVIGAGEAAAQAPPAPNPPTSLRATAGNMEVKLVWDAPARGETVASYELRYAASTAGLPSDWMADGDTGVTISGTTATVSSLDNGTAYRFQVRSVGVDPPGTPVAKPSRPSNTATATPLAVPGEPTGLKATPADKMVTLEWKKPDPPDTVGAEGEADSYEYRSYETADAGDVTANSPRWTSATGMMATVRGLKNGTDYTFAVRSKNSAGTSTGVTTTAIPAAKPSAPQNLNALRAVADNKLTVTLDWDAPSSTGGTGILLTGYDYRTVGLTTWIRVDMSVTTVTLSDLDPNTQYTFEVRAVNSVGEGPAASIASPAVAPPGMPTALMATPGDGEVMLKWGAPTNGGAPTGYQYQYGTSASMMGDWMPETPLTGMTATVPNLMNDTTYMFKVRAVNAGGAGTPTASVEATPTAATALSVTVSAAPTTIAEGGMSTITAMANRMVMASDGAVTVNLRVVGEATLDMNVITIAAGAMSGTATLTSTPDDDYVNDTVTVTATGTGVATDHPNVEIIVTDPEPAAPLSVTVSASPTTIAEGGMSTITATADRMVAAADGMVTVNLIVVGEATLSANSITIAAGAMSGTATLTSTADDDYEDDTVTVAASGTGIDGDQQITITVTDPEPAADLTVKVSAAPMTIKEGGTSTITAMANRMVLAADDTVTINLSVVGDAKLSANSITIAAGKNSGTVTLTATEDDDYEDETVTVTASGTGIDGNQELEITVTDNDQRPVPGVVRGQITEFKLIGDVSEKTIGGVKRLHVKEGSQDVELSVTVQWRNDEVAEIGYDTEQFVLVVIRENRADGPPPGGGNWLSWIDYESDVHFPQLMRRDGGWGRLGGWVVVKTPKESAIPAAQRDSARHTSSGTGKLPVLVLHDNHEAENDAFYIEAVHSELTDVDLNATKAVNMITPEVVIEDDEEQTVTVKGPKSVYESAGTAEFTLGASPQRVELPLDVVLQMLDLEGTTVSAAQISVSDASVEIGTGASAPKVTVHLPASDGNRKDDDYQMQASVNLYSLASGGFDTIRAKSAPIKVVDVHKLPTLTVNPPTGTVEEGDEIELTLTINRNPANTIATDPETRQYTEEAVDIMLTAGAGTTAGRADYELPRTIEFPEHNKKAPWTQEMKVMVKALADNELDDGEMLAVDAMVSGRKTERGADKDAHPGVSMLTIGDATGKLVWAKTQEEVEAAVYAAKNAGMGDDMIFTPGEMLQVMGSALFNAKEGVTLSYSAMTSDNNVASASVDSGGTAMVTAKGAGMADITITAHASMPSGVKIVDQTDPREASIMFPVEVGLEALSIMLSGPEDMNLAEGMSAMVTATANRAVTTEVTVMLMRDRSASSAGDADYTAEAITIAAGQTMGSTMVMAVEDGMSEDMEQLVLYGMSEGMAGEVTGEVTLNLWDAAVPALPVIAQLLLAALMAVGGYRRYRRR